MITTLSYLGMMIGAGNSPDPRQVFQQYMSQLQSAKSIIGEYELRSSSNPLRMGRTSFSLSKDNRFSVTGSLSREIFDGKSHFVINQSAKTFMVRDPKISGFPYQVGFESFPVIKGTSIARTYDITTAKADRFDGQNVVSVQGPDRTLYISNATSLPVGVKVNLGTREFEMSFYNVVINAPVAASEFAFASNGYRQVPNESAGMVRVGRVVNLESAKNEPELSKALSQTDLTVVAFVSGNDPSRQALEMLSDWGRKLSSKAKVVVVTADQKIAARVLNMKNVTSIYDQTVGSTTLGSAFGASEYPSIFLIDSKKKVLFRQVGVTEDFVLSAINSARP